MPYFRNIENNKNLLLIHIPKTGGTSVEKYLCEKYNTVLDLDSLYGMCHELDYTYQHFRYIDIKNKAEELNVDLNPENTKMITIVRNPYERFVSELFFRRTIHWKTPPERTIIWVKKYVNHVNKHFLDNHILPQHTFIEDENGKILDNITILKTENLSEMMREIGYDDFNKREVPNTQISQCDYYKYLNGDCLREINRYYARDFELFGYDIIDPDEFDAARNK